MSAIFYNSPEQQKSAEESKQNVPRAATAIQKAGVWTDAEEYHQNYVMKRREAGECTLS